MSTPSDAPLTDPTAASCPAHGFGMLEFSCHDVARVAGFWSMILGVPVDEGASVEYAQISPPEPLPKWLFLRRRPAGGTQAMTIAITSDDLPGSTAAAVAAGAVAHGIDELDGFRWSTLDDPEGNRFTFNAPPPR